MLWDGLIFLLFVGLAVAGWNVGIVNSWRGPLAVIIATVATQQFYVDFSTWIVQQLRIVPEHAVAIGYLLMWAAIELTSELLLNVILPFNKKSRPLLFERISGAALGIAKALVVVLLPMVALNGPINVPEPPPDRSALVNPLDSGINKANGVAFFYGVAKGLTPSVGSFVVSNKLPSFKPNFKGKTALDEEKDASNEKDSSK